MKSRNAWNGEHTGFGFRVQPVYALFDHRESDPTVKEFLEWNPEVKASHPYSGMGRGPQVYCRRMNFPFDHDAPVPLRHHLTEYSVNQSAGKGREMLENRIPIARPKGKDGGSS